ncbi:hypothetical protein [Neobacillus citreus]|nr:hypothetical protein [Neobacillus citreus]
MKNLVEKIGSHVYMRWFFIENIINLSALIVGLMIGAFLKMLFF